MTTVSPAPTTAPVSLLADPAAVEFLLALGRALHGAGAATYQLEDTLARIARRLGVALQVFATPTGIFIAFGPPERQRTSLLRVEPGAVNLEHIAALDAVGEAVASGRLTPEAGRAAVADIIAAPPRYGPLLIAICYAFAAAAVAALLGGGLREVIVSGGIGLAAGLTAVLAQRRRVSEWLTTLIAAFIAGLAAAVAGQTANPLTSFITIGSGLIVLMPGLTLTTAINELAYRHLAAGTARLAGAVITLLAIGFGAALGSAVGQLAPPMLEPSTVAPLPRWTALPALVVFAVTFLVMFGARPRDTGWIMASVVLAYGGTQIGGVLPGAQAAAFVAALVVGLASNLFARVMRQPEAIPLIPGITILVPGVVGYRSITALLERDTVSGIETAFAMALTAVSLVAGLLFANVILTPRRVNPDDGRP